MNNDLSYSVDPTNIPKVLTEAELEYFILFAIAVAGKNAKVTHKKLDAFLSDATYQARASATPFKKLNTPFKVVQWLLLHRRLDAYVVKHKFGQYRRIAKAMGYAAVQLDINNLTTNDLESVPGIGPKTARFVRLYSDPMYQGVPLDTHILKYIHTQCPLVAVPKSTPPTGRRYNELEEIFQELARRQGKTVRELDTQVWTAYNSGQQLTLKG